jgi:hypothetical protein
MSIPTKQDAFEKRKAKQQERLQARRMAEQAQSEKDQKARNDFYDETRDEDEGH